MTSQSTQLITYPAILIAVFSRQMCLPVPAVLFLMMAGALGGSGRMSLPLIIMTGVLGCLAADYAWFQAGRWWGSRILRILCAFASDRRRCAQRAREVFARHGLQVLIVAKFIPGLDGLMPPLSGLEGARSLDFLFFDGIGALLWSAAYSLIGYLFANRIAVVAATLNRLSSWFAIIVLTPFLSYLLWRAWELARMLRQLRVRTISPALLQEKLSSGGKIALLDLLLCEGDPHSETESGIPGAIRVDPVRLRKSPRVQVPDDVEVVLYCSSPKAVTSARVAVSLRHKGIRRVQVLEGGLNEWVRLKLPLTTELASPEEAGARLGITALPSFRVRLRRLHPTHDE